ncbi:head-tail adaptor protein [Halalkalibacterium halodurans]|uniref:head-tail adaptor protein n=1 Tax=Halalkalibacterium halodurans TaxID=86665 RepID=UPI002E1FF86E|nr:head-tail adaptor protein [Halalkalibacterium halodurans]
MKPKINPGDFRQKLIFQIPSSGKDADGFPIDDPILYVTVRAKLKTLRGKTFYEAAKTNMRHNREFTFRYHPKLVDGVRPKNLEVVWKDTKHKIESIENDDGLNITMTAYLRAVT